MPAPESAHAVHGAVQEALRAKEDGTSPVIVFCLSGHGLFDLAAYDEYVNGHMENAIVTDDVIMKSLEGLPVV